MMRRRQFLEVSTAAALSFMLVSSRSVGGRPIQGSIGALAQRITDTPRDQVLEMVARHIRTGLTLHELLGAVSLAGVREIKPYPSVGFQFHAVLVMQSVYAAALRGPARDYWLPLMWSVDSFKRAQATDVRAGDWSQPVAPTLPAWNEVRAEKELLDAFETWDPERADVATTLLAASTDPQRLFELYFRYGARDFRDIGHKAVFVQNCHRVLGVLASDCRLPVIRSLSYALQNHEGDPAPNKNDLAADRAWRANRELVASSDSGELRTGLAVKSATHELLDVLRTAGDVEAARLVLKHLQDGANVQTVWDALALMAAELMLRRPGILALHANTMTNALHYGFRASRDRQTRVLLILQAAALLVSFRRLIERGSSRDLRIATFEAELQGGMGDTAVEAIFADLKADRLAAVRRILGYLQRGGDPMLVQTAARHYTVYKTAGVHDYKFTEAMLEQSGWVSPRWRSRLLAVSAMWLNGASDDDNEVVVESRRLLRA